MKILVFCQYYSPEPFRHPDICEKLVKKGHEVTVVTGIPNYPMGKVYDGYGFFTKKNEVINGVKVHRCFTIPRKTGVINRFLNYYSYALSSSIYAKLRKKQYDVVFVNQLSPVMMACPGIVYKKKHNVKLVLYCLDLWPESLVAGGIERESVIYKIFHRISKKIYSKADKILITSKSFSKYFEDEFGIADTIYLPQYAEDLFSIEACKKTSDEFYDFMFAGNVGTMQSVDTIIEAAKLTKEESKIRWHIVGDGSELENIQKMANGMKNVFFYGRKSLNEMPKYYSLADAMLVTMKSDPIISLTLPGKVQTYMSAGKPIIGAIDGETKNIISDAKCGYCGNAEDASMLADNVRNFIKNQNKEEMGLNARKYYEKNFEEKLFINRIESIFKG